MLGTELLSPKKWSLTIRILPVVAGIVILKYALHITNLEIISSNPFLPSLVAATVFLIGFLLSGILSDYKESEKLPGEIASSIETIADEISIIHQNKKLPEAREFLLYLREFSMSLETWFYRKIRTRELFAKLRGFNRYFAVFESHTQATFITRIKQEQHNLRRMITRIHSIMDVSFIPSGYAIVEGGSGLLIIALLLTKMDPFFESLFFFIPVVYLFVYMISLISDLDNPFEYNLKGERFDEVSIKEIHDQIKRLNDRIAELD